MLYERLQELCLSEGRSCPRLQTGLYSKEGTKVHPTSRLCLDYLTRRAGVCLDNLPSTWVSGWQLLWVVNMCGYCWTAASPNCSSYSLHLPVAKITRLPPSWALPCPFPCTVKRRASPSPCCLFGSSCEDSYGWIGSSPVGEEEQILILETPFREWRGIVELEVIWSISHNLSFNI